jgi:hypothetical protein
MPTLANSPGHGDAYRAATDDDGTVYTFLPDDPDDDLPWRAVHPDGVHGWLGADELPDDLVPADD